MIVCVVVYSSRAALPCSRGPNEDCFSPPKGAWKSTPEVGMFTRIMPVSSPSTTVSAESRSRVKTDVTSPNGTPLEISTACSAELGAQDGHDRPEDLLLREPRRRVLAVDHRRA